MFLEFLALSFFIIIFWYVYIKFIFKYLVLQRKINKEIEEINNKFNNLKKNF